VLGVASPAANLWPEIPALGSPPCSVRERPTLRNDAEPVTYRAGKWAVLLEKTGKVKPDNPQ